MDAAQTIRDAVAQVAKLRAESVANPQLAAAIATIKAFQTARFKKTYADILSGGPYQGAAQFFLEELYGEEDFSKRDAQFSRIAAALQKLLPSAAVATAVLLAQLHLLTEELDHAMGRAWLSDAGHATANISPKKNASRYIQAWQKVGGEAQRQLQIQSVLKIGHDLERLTRIPGLRLTLKMMRLPAFSAGLSDLQIFLERGFDTFADLGKGGGRVTRQTKITQQHNGSVSDANRPHLTNPSTAAFLSLIELRESELITQLFTSDPVHAVRFLDEDG